MPTNRLDVINVITVVKATADRCCSNDGKMTGMAISQVWATPSIRHMYPRSYFILGVECQLIAAQFCIALRSTEYSTKLSMLSGYNDALQPKQSSIRQAQLVT